MTEPSCNKVFSARAYENLMRKAASSGFGRLEIPGKSVEGDPVYALTLSDFSVEDDLKFHILIAGLHVGGERAALLAFRDAIRFLLRKSSRKYLERFAITLMPVVNPYGCFRKTEDQYHLNSSGYDMYTGRHGKSFHYPELSLVDPEHEPELAAFCKVIDQVKPEILLDWHGASGLPGTTMRETLGASLSNHLITPWGTRLLAAMRQEVCKGKSAVFDLEEYLERIPAPPEYRAMYPSRVRPSNAVFYPDLYATIRYHAMPIVMEIGQAETGWRALKGLMDYALNPPPEYRGSLPVDHVGVDFGAIVASSHGKTPGERRRSRCELQEKSPSFLTFYLTPMRIGEVGAALVLGNSGKQIMAGDLLLREMARHAASEFPAGEPACRRKLFGKLSEQSRLLPLLANTNYSEDIPDCGTLQEGICLQFFLPVGHRRNLRITECLLNGEKMAEGEEDGYELVRGSDGWHLFLNLSPKRTRHERLFHVLVHYES